MKKENNNVIKNEDDGLCRKDVLRVQKMICQIESNLLKIKQIISSKEDDVTAYKIDTKVAEEYIEGIFDGRFMVGDDGKKYLVPENYASKSKLVEGDRLKLVIALDGTYVYKQILPIDRIKETGRLKEVDESYIVETDDQKYNVLKASRTYFKIKSGDRLTIILPKSKKAKWAAVENKIE